MPEHDEFSPQWGDEQNVPAGTYIWMIHIGEAVFRDLDKEKPYAKLSCVVIEGAQIGYKFDFRLYVSKAAKGWATYFLKKFEYPEDLLTGENPRLQRSKLEGLEGKILIELSDTERGRQHDAKGFDHVTGKELEERIKPKDEVTLPGDQSDPAEQSVDVEADVKTDEDPFAGLDEV